MLNNELPLTMDEQIKAMKKYVLFRQRKRMCDFLQYVGYFRASRYGKFLLTCVENLGYKPKQDMLFQLYEFDVNLRNILIQYCNKAEIRFKSGLSNAVSIKTQNAAFYLEQQYYTPTKSEKDSKTRKRNISYFNNVFFKDIVEKENKLRKDVMRHPELKEYRKGGSRHSNRIPVWAAFSCFELGTVTMLYGYLRGDLRKAVLDYTYTNERHKKEATKQMDTWLDAMRNLRNYCAHNSMVSGMTSSVVILDLNDRKDILLKNTDLFSRFYALRKLLTAKEGENLKKDVQRLIRKTKIDIYQLGILPHNWIELYDWIVEF